MKTFLFPSPRRLPIEALWCKNHENTRDPESHTWPPLTLSVPLVAEYGLNNFNILHLISKDFIKATFSGIFARLFLYILRA